MKVKPAKRTRPRRQAEPGPASEAPAGLPPESLEVAVGEEAGEAGGGHSPGEQPAPLILDGQPFRPERVFSTDGAGSDTLLVRKTLRSGQHVGHRGNVVVLGDVNPGAEVVAGGDILVMGALRGVAHAGARGDEAAVVAGFRLRPTQLRIGNYIARAPDGDITGPELPEVAQVREGRVVIRPYHPTGRLRPRP